MPQILVAIIQLVAAALISAALAPKVRPPKPAAFDEFDFPQAEEGTPVAVFFGDCWSEDWMVLGVGNYRNEAINVSGGKK